MTVYRIALAVGVVLLAVFAWPWRVVEEEKEAK